MSKVSEIITSERFKTFAAAVGAVVMYFTPDPYDAVITAMLSAFGVSTLIIHKKDECK